MDKANAIRQRDGDHIRESMGAGRLAPLSPGKPPAAPDRHAGLGRARGAAEIPLDRIIPDPDQPREECDPDALARLAESLRTRGQLQPIRVRWEEAAGHYVILCGERRWRAAGLAGLPTLTAIVQEGDLSPADRLAIQLVENCLREDLRPIEQARAYRALMDAHDWTARQAAAALAIHETTVSKALALLDTAPQVQALVESGQLSPATAYEVSRVPDPADQAEIAEQAAAERWTRDQVAAVARTLTPERRTTGRPRKATRTFRTPKGEWRFTADGPELTEADLRTEVRALTAQINGRGRGAA